MVNVHVMFIESLQCSKCTCFDAENSSQILNVFFLMCRTHGTTENVSTTNRILIILFVFVVAVEICCGFILSVNKK